MKDLNINDVEERIKGLLKKRSKIDYEIMQLEAYRDILQSKIESGFSEGAQTYSSNSEHVADNGDLTLEKMEQVPEEISLLKWESKQPSEATYINSFSIPVGLSDQKNHDRAVSTYRLIDQKRNERPPPIDVNKNSPIEEKYALFLFLFAGRPDVHAKRYFSITKGTHGYSPVCNNLFNKALCPKGDGTKKQTKCIECKNRDFPKISLEEFTAHIKGEKHDYSDVLGAYPMDANEMCSFIVADFDNENRNKKSKGAKSSKAKGIDSNNSLFLGAANQFESLKREAIAFQKTCAANHVPAYLERSRSGDGFHIWIFFSERIPAMKARQLCSSVHTIAMNEHADLSFASYDRLIPNQDNLPSDNGLGNLIALPLQGGAGKRGNSLFIDEALNYYPDQWTFLSTIKKMHTYEVDQILGQLSPNNDLGVLVPNTDEDDIDDNKDNVKPWEKRKAEVALSTEDFNGEIEIVSANVIYMEKSKLSVRAVNRLKRLGAYKNPEYYKAQAMRMRTDDKPRIVSTVDENSGYICIPRGALNDIKELLENAGATYYVSEKTTDGRILDVSFIGQLKEDQKPAADALLSHDIGVLSVPGGFGKTVIGTYLVAQRAVNTLILVHSQQVYDQWKDELNEHLEIKNEPAYRLTPTGLKKVIGVIGEYRATKKHLSDLVDVAMTQSLSRSIDEMQFVKDYGMVIIDECHRIPATTFEAVLKQVNAKYVYGLTATPYRDDGHHAILFLRCGPIRYKVDDRKQAEKRPFEHFVIPRFTELLPTSVHNTDNTQQLLTGASTDAKRNEMIINDILASVKSGRNPIVLSERVDHVNTLVGLLVGKCDNVIKLIGSMKTDEKRIVNKTLSEMKEGDEFVIVATGKYAGEGFDFPRLDTLFLALPISYKGKINQYTGRLHRMYEGKKDVIVYDYVDINIPVLERMYYKRVRGYKSVGYKTAAAPVIPSQADDMMNIIFAYKDYLAVFSNDVSAATSEIVISSPDLSKNGITSLIQKLSIKIIDNTIVTVITKPSNEYNEDKQQSAEQNIRRLLDSGAKVVEYSDLHQKFAVIDQRVVWYGSVNLLGLSGKDDNMMRLDGTDIAMAILKQHYGCKAVIRHSDQISLFT